MVQRYIWVGVRGITESDFGNYVTYEDYQKLEVELEQLRQQVREPADDGWVEWGGGERPVPCITDVGVKFRDGTVLPDKAGEFRWIHDGDAMDIIAYRIVRN